MKEQISIENKTDLGANQISLIETRINELLNVSGASISLNRTGEMAYSIKEQDDEYNAIMFIQSLDYVIDKNAVVVRCKTPDCISLTRTSDEMRIESTKVSLTIASAEQGDQLIAYLNQFHELCRDDTNIDTGIKRRLKKWVDKVF